MLRRGGGGVEKLFLAGCALMFAVEIISVSLDGMMPWISEQRISARGLGIIRLVFSGIPSMAGFVCLILAFWFRFRRNGRTA